MLNWENPKRKIDRYVQTPDGKPAQNAYVSIATLNRDRRVSQIHNGKPNDTVFFDNETHPYGTATNDAGQFLFPEIDYAKERITFDEKLKSFSVVELTKVPPPVDFAVLILLTAAL